MDKDLDIIIKKGMSIFSIKRSEFVSCNETADGMVFQLKTGIMLYYTDNMLDSGTKLKIKLTIDSMNSGNILIDFNNPKNIIQFFAPE